MGKAVLKITIKNEIVQKILEQIPKSIKGLYIEQAILEFSSRNPRVEFYFDGITKPKRNKAKKMVIETDHSDEIPINPKPNTHLTNSKRNKGTDDIDGQMMYAFPGV